jgi:hypothetical protein
VIEAVTIRVSQEGVLVRVGVLVTVGVLVKVGVRVGVLVGIWPQVGNLNAPMRVCQLVPVVW